MGLLEYYKQFSGMTEEEIAIELRTRAGERRRKELARIEALDLSRTTWHEFPHPDVVAAVTFAARGALNRAPDAHAVELRRELARRSGVEPTRVVAGHGAAQLLADAALALFEPGDELLTPWPSYSLYPRMARRAGGRAVPITGGFDVSRLIESVGERTRAIVLCNPNDPTGEYLPCEALDELLTALPDRVWLLLDEALTDFAGADETVGSLGLLDDHPRLLVFRTFSKAYGLAGLRCGWALGGSGAEELLEHLEPELGLSTPVQAGAIEALLECAPQVAARRDIVAHERERLLGELAAHPVEVHPSKANFLWLSVHGMSGIELTDRLRRAAVLVWPGTEVGDREHVRVAIQSPTASDRLLEAIGRATAERDRG
ncbi:MAG: histidinol-phosphate aminotransferase [Solirubrobacteraceae bacterium]|nr:histidinol-phosphate aminotransferase [Solirubrobacteraceae bacterium]